MADFAPITPIPFQFVNPDTGALASGFTLEAYVAGTTTPAMMYQDANGTNLGTTVTINSAGYPTNGSSVVMIWLSTVLTYKFILKDASGGQQWEFDDISVVSGGGGGSTEFETIGDFEAGSTPGGVVYISGFDSVADGGQGYFWLDTDDTTSVSNGGTIIVDATTPRIGTWKRIIDQAGITQMAWFGVKPGAWDQAACIAAWTWGMTTGNAEFHFEPGVYLEYLVDAFTLPIVVDQHGRNKYHNMKLVGHNTVFYTDTPYTTREEPRLNIIMGTPDQYAVGDWEFECEGFEFKFTENGTSRPRIWDITRGKSITFTNCKYDQSSMFLSIGGNQYTRTGGYVKFRDFDQGNGVTVGRRGREFNANTSDRQFTLVYEDITRSGNSSLLDTTLTDDSSNNIGTSTYRPRIELDGFYNDISTTTQMFKQNSDTYRNNVSLQNMYNFSSTSVFVVAEDASGTPSTSATFTMRNTYGEFQCLPSKCGRVVYDNCNSYVNAVDNVLTADNCLQVTYINSYSYYLQASDCESVTAINSRFYASTVQSRAQNASTGCDALQLISCDFQTSFNSWSGANISGFVQYWGSESTLVGNAGFNTKGYFSADALNYNLPSGFSITRNSVGRYTLSFPAQASAESYGVITTGRTSENFVTNAVNYTTTSCLITCDSINTSDANDSAISFDFTSYGGENIN